MTKGKWILVILLTASIMLLFLGCDTKQQQTSTKEHTSISKIDPNRVVIGESVGPVSLGMSEEEAVTVGKTAWGKDPILAKSDFSGIAEDELKYLKWPGVSVRFKQEGEKWIVDSIVVEDERFKSVEGFRVGISYDKATKLIGEPIKVSWHASLEGMKQKDYSTVPGYGVVTWQTVEALVRKNQIKRFIIKKQDK